MVQCSWWIFSSNYFYPAVVQQYHWQNSVQFLHNLADATYVLGAFLTFDSPAVSPYASASPPESNVQGAQNHLMTPHGNKPGPHHFLLEHLQQ